MKNTKTVLKATLLIGVLTIALTTSSSGNDTRNDGLFKQATLIGKVFFDANLNGYLDAGERGIPAVRIISVTGLVIETDGYGRFHVPHAVIQSQGSGYAQLFKVDVSSLPIGAHITTENPRLVRNNSSIMNKLNFGIVF